MYILYRHLKVNGSLNFEQFRFIIPKTDRALFLIVNICMLNNNFVSKVIPKSFIICTRSKLVSEME